MQIVAIADDESRIGCLASHSTDVLISLGDLFDAVIQRAMGLYRPRQSLAVRGNHDTNGPLPSGVADLHLSVHEIDGVRFGGFAGSWRYKPRGHHLYEQDEVAGMLKDFPPVDVFVAHNSPFGIHQRDGDVHQGFHAFRAYICRAKPCLFLHGHQHVSHTTILGGTTILGIFGERSITLEGPIT